MAEYCEPTPAQHFDQGTTSTVATPGIYINVKPNPKWAAADARHEADGRRFTVYAIRLASGGIYIGQTKKSAMERFQEHLDGKGASICRDEGIIGDGPLWSVQASTRVLAMQLEEVLHNAFHRAGFRCSTGSPN